MIICKEIAEYIRYAEEHPKRINRERKLLIENIALPTIRRNDVFFDEKTYQNYELMTREPKLEILVRIADCFDVSLDYLTGRTDIRK